jgi:hypothetical protein
MELFCEAVPRTAENFLALCASGEYDNTIWHRNIKGFMIQSAPSHALALIKILRAGRVIPQGPARAANRYTARLSPMRSALPSR